MHPIKKAMQLLNIIMIFSSIILSCNENKDTNTFNKFTVKSKAENPYAQIKSIPLPAGFVRVNTDSASFSYYLRNISLKDETTVYLYNGQPKQNQTAQFAILNISLDKTDLQQCADAVMRL